MHYDVEKVWTGVLLSLMVWCQTACAYVCIYGISAVLTKGRKRKWTIVINLLVYDIFIFSCKFSTVSFCQALWEFFRKRGQLEKYWYNKIGALSLLSHFHNSTVYWFCIAKFCANPACPKRMLWGLFQDLYLVGVWAVLLIFMRFGLGTKLLVWWFLSLLEVNSKQFRPYWGVASQILTIL